MTATSAIAELNLAVETEQSNPVPRALGDLHWRDGHCIPLSGERLGDYRLGQEDSRMPIPARVQAHPGCSGRVGAV